MDVQLSELLKTLHSNPNYISVQSTSQIERSIIKNPRYNFVACALPYIFSEHLKTLTGNINDSYFDKLLITVPPTNLVQVRDIKEKSNCIKLQAVLFLTHMIFKTQRTFSYSSDAEIVISQQLDQRFKILKNLTNSDQNKLR